MRKNINGLTNPNRPGQPGQTTNNEGAMGEYVLAITVVVSLFIAAIVLGGHINPIVRIAATIGGM